MCESSRPDHIPSTQRCHPEAPSQQGVSSGGGPAAMPLSRLDHVNLRTAELAAMQPFYSEVLGMSLCPRPPFSFDGAWLYCGVHATLHLVQLPVWPAPVGEQRLDPFAVSAEGWAKVLALL